LDETNMTQRRKSKNKYPHHLKTNYTDELALEAFSNVFGSLDLFDQKKDEDEPDKLEQPDKDKPKDE
jgi:hypothetical protein